MAQADIGLIGLGVMGASLALNIAENGFTVAVHNRTASRIADFHASSGALASRIVPCATIEALAAAIRPPRPVILMVQAGAPVDEQFALLRPVLDRGDILIDAGNANFRDTVRRFDELKDSGLEFVGMGVSGGEEGARHGPSIMAGAAPDAYARIEPVLTAISAKFRGEACAARVGPGGAGHFVKTIHNGIEYADMQMIAEIYGLLRDGAGLGASEIGDRFDAWRDGPLDSYLVDITARVLKAIDPQTKLPVVDVIVDSAGQKGTGRWSAIEAQTLGVAATGIEAAVAARSLSSLRSERAKAALAYGAEIDRAALAGLASDTELLELALLAGKIAAYAQGFAVMKAASDEFGWDMRLDVVARIWRAGCIIRSRFLDDIANAFAAGGSEPNLLLQPAFIDMMSKAAPSLRRVVAGAALAGTPVPALSSALAYFDTYRQPRGTANLIQGQRDFFGAHGFRRTDKSGDFHGEWGNQGGL